MSKTKRRNVRPVFPLSHEWSQWEDVTGGDVNLKAKVLGVQVYRSTTLSGLIVEATHYGKGWCGWFVRLSLHREDRDHTLATVYSDSRLAGKEAVLNAAYCGRCFVPMAHDRAVGAR